LSSLHENECDVELNNELNKSDEKEKGNEKILEEGEKEKGIKIKKKK